LFIGLWGQVIKFFRYLRSSRVVEVWHFRPFGYFLRLVIPAFFISQVFALFYVKTVGGLTGQDIFESYVTAAFFAIFFCVIFSLACSLILTGKNEFVL